MWHACSWCIPDIKVIWYSIECQSGKASVTVAVVVQRDGSQGDSEREYEQQLPITTSTPHVIVAAPVLLLSKIRVSQLKLSTITVGVIICVWWVSPTFGTGTLSSADRVIPIGIL